MNDKCMPAGDQSAPSAQETGRRQNEPLTKIENSSGLSIGYDQPVPGTSAKQNRQGYCSCCQVLYNSLEQHILTTRHRDFVSNSRNNVAANSLMERFLQDVIQHHPYRYNDIRPTHADLPSLNLPLVPKEELSDVYCLPEDERETVGTREEMPSTDDESGPVILVKEVKSIMDNRQNKRKALQTHKFNRSSFPGSTMPTEDLKRHSFSSVTVKSNSPTQGFLHRTSSNTDSSLYENPLPHNQPCSSQTAQNPSVSRRNAIVANCDLKADINTELLKHNNNSVSGTAFNILPAIKHISAGPSFTVSHSSAFGIPKHHSEQSQGKCADSQSHLRNMTGACSSQRTCAVGHPGTVMKIHSKEDQGYNRYKDQVLQAEDTVGEAIEEVIRKHCYSIPTQETSFEDETSFHLLLGSLANPCNFSESGTSTEWDTPIKRDPGPLKDLGCLKEAHIDLEDKKYESQLSSVLHLHPEAEKKENHKKEEEGNGDIKECKNDNGLLLPLPHIPQSFVGKTWSQVMYEDDLKIEALVREFRDGHFRCYFESESSASYGKKSKKQKQKVVANKTFTESNEASATKEAVPLFDHVNMDDDDDGGDYNHSSLLIPVCKTPLEKKPEKRTWRLASRCQVVKVSHGTQTSIVNYPVVKKRILRKYSDPTDAKQTRYELDCEKTPDMKTRLCALKLPEAYSKIMSPFQPKSLVYVLSSPETTQCPLKPVCFRKTGRKRKSTESESTIRYTYKMTPLKFYDSLTNRILKTQPKGVACKPKTFTHVRKLFRSLSPDIKQMNDSQNESDLSSCLEADIPPEKDSSASYRKPGIRSCSRSNLSRNRIILSPLNSSKPYTKGAMILSPQKNKTTESFNVCKNRNSRRQTLVKQDPKSEQGSSRNKLTGPNSQTKSVRTKVNLKRQRMENKGTKRPDFVSASKTSSEMLTKRQKNGQKTPRADNKKKIKFTKGLLSRGKPEKKLEASRKTGLRSSLEKENPNIKVSEKSAEVLMERCKNPTEASRKQLENESSDNRRELRSSRGKSYSNKPLVKRNLRSSSKSI
ncbi:DBF4-type zinc finger-containing protein 2 isoform X1 [Acipenser oxyrinchus oxyrinchus]|uniref:DBF4-type zinc finger-containing protein 2 isoform X1 n=1 Tax=Acipenser oxyrinchus oxyrinchus TaxID=40147 RepID=A0AAD8DCV5_ACIOX|nr:DBF4-type zinc finger-containing protein 2 isoform X1 [Acipenser oxyrinchus oxyrinchus]